MKIGDRIRISDVDPKYAGQIGEIVDIRNMLFKGRTVTKYVIDLDDKAVLEHISLHPGDKNYILLSEMFLEKI